MRSRLKPVACVFAAVLVAGGSTGAFAASTTPNAQQYGDPSASEPPTVPVVPSAATPAPPPPPAAPEQRQPLTPPTKQKPEATQSAPPASETLGESTPTAEVASTLPFTGQNIALVVGLGGALVLVGLGLRLAGRRDT